jgi:diamine N-acetyltransferase
VSTPRSVGDKSEADLVTDNAAKIDAGQDGSAVVTVTPVTAENWRLVADLDVRDEQRAFVAPVTYYLALCAYDGGPWQPLVVYSGATVVGFVMEAVDPSDGSCWIGGVVIDSASQGRGFGRATMEALIARARAGSRPSVGLSYHPDNTVARQLYASLGFVETGEVDGHEGVSRLSLGK